MPRPSEIWRNLPGSAGRLLDESLELISPQFLFDPHAGFTEAQEGVGQIVSDVASRLWEDIPLVQAHRLQRDRELQQYYGREDDAAPYEFTSPITELETLTELGTVAERLSPVGVDEGSVEWRGTGAIAEFIEQDPAELLLELGTLGIGAAFAGVRHAARAARPFGRNVFDGIDMPSGVDYGQRRQAATVKLDLARPEGFVGGAMGGVIRDPETGRHFVSTAAHFVVGQEGRPVDFQGIRARTGTGEIGTVKQISAIDLERDIALLEVSGLSETLDLPDMPLGGPQSLLGREGITSDAHIVGESGASIEITPGRIGGAGESGAPLISQGADVSGIYLGEIGEVEPRGMYASGAAVSELLSTVGDTGVRLGPEISRRAKRQGLHYRYERGQRGVVLEGRASRAEGVGVSPEAGVAPFLLPQLQLASRSDDAVGLHSLDPEAELELHESRFRRRFAFGKEESPELFELLGTDELAELYSTVSHERGLFFRVGQRGENVSAQRTFDVEQTREYQEWYSSERPPWEIFGFEGGGQVTPETLLGGIESKEVHSSGVLGFQDITALGRHLRDREIGEGEVLQVFRGQAPQNLPMDLSTYEQGQRFVYQPDAVAELELPTVEGLQDIYQEIQSFGGAVEQPISTDRTVPMVKGFDLALADKPSAPMDIIDELSGTELEVQARVGSGNVTEYHRDPLVVPDRSKERKLDVENWTWEDLQRETYYADSYRAGKASDEMQRRMLSQHTGAGRQRVISERRRIEARDAETGEAEAAREAGMESDFEDGLYVPSSNPDAPRDYTETFESQDYKSEGWEAREGTEGDDDTGKIFEGWEDVYGDFNKNDVSVEDVLVEAADEKGFTKIEGGVEVSFEQWIDEYGVEDRVEDISAKGIGTADDTAYGSYPWDVGIGTEGTLVGSALESEKVSSVERFQSTGSKLRPETQEQFSEVFSSFFEGIEQREQGLDPVEGREIIRRMNVRDPQWRSKMRAAVQGNRAFQTEQLKPFFESEMQLQSGDWQARAKELWSSGEFEGFYHHVEPLRESAYRRYQEAHRRGEIGEPTDNEVLARRDIRRRQEGAYQAQWGGDEDPLSSKVYNTLLENRQAQIGRLEQSRIDPIQEDLEELFWKEAKIDAVTYNDPAALGETWYESGVLSPEMDPESVLWHKREISDYERSRTNLKAVERQRVIDTQQSRVELFESQQPPDVLGVAFEGGTAAEYEAASAWTESLSSMFSESELVSDVVVDLGEMMSDKTPEVNAAQLRESQLTRPKIRPREVGVAEAESLRPEVQQQQAAMRVSESAQQQHALISEQWRQAESHARRQQDDSSFDEFREAQAEEIQKKSERARRATLREMAKERGVDVEEFIASRTVETHSAPDAPAPDAPSREELTSSQQRALEHTTGAAVVMAGPGSGKSRTLIERLRYLSDEGHATSDDVLTLVFGKKAQLDLQERASELGGDWEISTVDAFARSVVRENFGELGYTRAPDISEMTFRDWLSKPGRLSDFGVSELSKDIPGAWSDLYEGARRGFSEGRENYSALPEPVQEAIHGYRVERFKSAKMDFSDAVSQAGYLLESNEAVRQRYQDRYKFLQVDEYQDVSSSQARFIQRVSQNPWVVGDLDQSIMSFRGGTGDAMRQMIEGGASIYNIEENFRSTPEIVGAAQGFIHSNLGRIDATQESVKPSGTPVSMVGVDPLVPERSAIARIAEQVREGEETAILTRTLRERDVIERELPVELRQQGWEDSEIENLLTFESMHAAKGREWQNVILPINLLESDFGQRQRLFTLPTPYAKTALELAEEERLFYVGMTRAEENLTIMGDPSHPYYSQVTRAIEGASESEIPAYLAAGDEVVPQQRRGILGGLVGRVGEAFDRLIHGDTSRRTGRREQPQTEAERRRRRGLNLHSKEIDIDELNTMADEAADADVNEFYAVYTPTRDVEGLESSDVDLPGQGLESDDLFVGDILEGGASLEQRSVIQKLYPHLDVDQLTEEQALLLFQKSGEYGVQPLGDMLESMGDVDTSDPMSADYLSSRGGKYHDWRTDPYYDADAIRQRLMEAKAEVLPVSVADRNEMSFPGGSAGGPGDLSELGVDFTDGMFRRRGRSIGSRFGRWSSEQSEDRAWGGATSYIAEIAQNAALINAAASLTVEGVRMAAGHDLNIGSLAHAGVSSMLALGATVADARFGSRGVLPESLYNLSDLGSKVSDVPSGAGAHLQRIFREAGAGTSRWGRGSLSRELERYDLEDLESMFGESGASYLTEFGHQTRRFGQKSHQTQRDWSQTLLGIFSGDIPRARRYGYDPETRDVNVETGRRMTLDRLLEFTSESSPALGAWMARRQELRENPDKDILNRWSRGVIPPLQGEDVKPNIAYMMLPEARGIGRFFGRYHAEPDNAKAWNLEEITRGIGAEGWANRIVGRKEFKRERASVHESRRMSPELYQWQDPEHLFSEISGTLGVSDSDVSFGSERLGSPYSRFGRHVSRLPRSARYPLAGAGAGAAGKLLYDYFSADDEDEQLVLDDPAGYSLSPRYPVFGAVQRSKLFRRLRARSEQFFDDVYGEDTIHSALLKSIVGGKKGILPRDVKDTFVQTGQIHALTQSGMHMSIFSSVFGRYPALLAPAALSVAHDTLFPPDERVVESSQAYLDKFKPSDDPWSPRWNPELPTSGQIRMLKSQKLLPEDYEIEIPEPPSWAWWDPAENYRKDEERRAESMATENQVNLLGSLGLLPEGYEVDRHKREEISLIRGEPGIQDVLPWAVYGMFGVLPETGYSYSQQENEGLPDVGEEPGENEIESDIPVQMRSEDYKIDGFEFDVHGSPHPGFNPWLDPTPEGLTGLPEDDVTGSFRGIPIGRIGSELFDFASRAYQKTGDEGGSLEEIYEMLGINSEDGISRDEASRLIEFSKSGRSGSKDSGNEREVSVSDKAFGYMDSLRRRIEDLPPRNLISFEDIDFSRPQSDWTREEVSSGIWHYQQQQKQGSDSQRTQASSLPSESSFGFMQSLRSRTEGLAPYDLIPFEDIDFGRPRSEWTQGEVSSGIWHYQQQREQESGSQGAQAPSLPSESSFGFMQSLRSRAEGLPPDDLIPFGDLDFGRPRSEWTQGEVSSGIWHYQQQRGRDDSDSGSEREVPVSDKAFGFMQSLRSRTEGLPPDGLIPFEDIDFGRPQSEWTQGEVSSGIWHYQQQQEQMSTEAPEKDFSDSAFRYLQSLNPARYGEPKYDVLPIEDVDFTDGLTVQEGAALIDYEKAVQKSEGPPMASEAQVSALQRYFPQMFGDAEVEESPLVPLAQIDFTDGVTREEAREAFRHVKESPPPMATPRQVARLEMEFPHAFKQLGRAGEYLESGQSYGVVQSLEDIYDADTFTGMLFDAESGQTFKEDTVRLGDFDAPEIRPDRMKPREYQEREAARAREARDVFRSFVERFNVGRDVQEEGYVVPIEFRHDPNMLGGLDRGRFGRVLGDVNFEGIDYEQFMIQQQMGSVYGADIEWGAEQIDPLALWRRTPTLSENLGKDAEDTLWSIPTAIVGKVFGGENPVDAVTGTFGQIPGHLKNVAVQRAQQTATQATKDFFKERLTDEFTPNNLSFAQRYLGDFGGLGEKAGGFLESGFGAALAPIALAAGTALIGERSLDANYADVIPSEGEREKAWNQHLLDRREAQDGLAPQSSEAAGLRMIKRALREVLSETGLGSVGDLSVGISRKLRESDARGITRNS